MKIQSLKRQVIVGLLLVEVCCALSLTGVALLNEWHIRLRALDTVIRGRSDSLLGAIQDAEDPGDNVTIDPTELVLPREDVYAVYTGDHRLIGSSPAAPAAIIAARSNGFSSRSVDGRHYRTLERSALRVIDRSEHGGVGLRRPVTIVYAVESRHIWHEVFEAASYYVMASITLVILSAAVILVLLRRALLPIQELAHAAGDVSFRALAFAPPASALGVLELRPLVQTLSATVDGLKQSVDQQNRFIGDAAHELKTAVAVVRSSIQLLMMRPRAASEYAAGLETLLEDSARVEELVARMLASARFEEQRSKMLLRGPQATDLREICARTVDRLRPLVEARKLRVKLEGVGPIQVPLSPDEIDVLVSNLLVNAAQHSFPGGEIRVSLLGEGDVARLVLTDRGGGISQQALPHIFERFFREDSSRSRETGGAGLGLSICQSIVDGALGTIAVESAEGYGTTVTVTLPLITLPVVRSFTLV